MTGVGILANTTITPNIPDVLNDLDRSDGSAGLLVAAGASPAVFIAPVIGALAPDFNMLIAARLVQGAGGAGLINLALVLIADNWDGLERTRLIGRNSAVLTTRPHNLGRLSLRHRCRSVGRRWPTTRCSTPNAWSPGVSPTASS